MQRQIERIVGRITVPRLAYPEPSCRDLHPMDATLNLPRELFPHRNPDARGHQRSAVVHPIPYYHRRPVPALLDDLHLVPRQQPPAAIFLRKPKLAPTLRTTLGWSPDRIPTCQPRACSCSTIAFASSRSGSPSAATPTTSPSRATNSGL